MFRAWNIVDNGIIENRTGHHYWEAKALSDELLERGKLVRILAHNSVPAADFPGAKLLPIFLKAALARGAASSPAKALAASSRAKALAAFAKSNAAFYAALSRTNPLLFRGGVTLFPSLSEKEMGAVCRWLSDSPESLRPKVVMVFSPVSQRPGPDHAGKLYPRLVAKWFPLVGNNIVLAVRSEDAAKQFSRLIGITPHVLPSLLAPQGRLRAPFLAASARDVPMTVAFVAGGRSERGVMLLPEIVRNCSSPDIRFFVQAREHRSANIEAIRALEGWPHVTVHNGVLERDAYLEIIASSVVLLPYDPPYYRIRASGVYSEAKCLGAPVLVPEGTSMAADVKRCGNGLVFEDYSAAGIAACIHKARAELPRLVAAARACADAFREQHGAGRYVEAVEALIADPRSVAGTLVVARDAKQAAQTRE